MRLNENVHPTFKGDFLESLHLEGIFSVVDFLSQEVPKITELSDLSEEDVDALRLCLFSKYAPQATTALDRLCPAGSIRSGVASLDQLLGGEGFLTGRIYEVFGLPGSGKTQLALSLLAECVLCAAKQSNAIYFDAKNDFFVSRLQEIIEERKSGDAASSNALDKIRVKRVHSFDDLLNALFLVNGIIDSAGSVCGDDIDRFWFRLRLVVVDNVASLVLPELQTEGDGIKRVFARVESLVGQLQKLAEERNVCVLVVNNATLRSLSGAAAETLHRPSLGKVFSNAADVRLQIGRVDEQNRTTSARNIRVDKGVRMAVDASCKVSVTKRGLDE